MDRLNFFNKLLSWNREDSFKKINSHSHISLVFHLSSNLLRVSLLSWWTTSIRSISLISQCNLIILSCFTLLFQCSPCLIKIRWRRLNKYLLTMNNKLSRCWKMWKLISKDLDVSKIDINRIKIIKEVLMKIWALFIWILMKLHCYLCRIS